MNKFNVRDKTMAYNHLMIVHQHIMMAERNVAEQEAHIKCLDADGYDKINAEELLFIFNTTLQALYSHHAQILAALSS